MAARRPASARTITRIRRLAALLDGHHSTGHGMVISEILPAVVLPFSSDIQGNRGNRCRRMTSCQYGASSLTSSSSSSSSPSAATSYLRPVCAPSFSSFPLSLSSLRSTSSPPLSPFPSHSQIFVRMLHPPSRSTAMSIGRNAKRAGFIRPFSAGGFKNVYEKPRGRKPTSDDDKWKQAKVVLIYSIILGGALYIYSNTSTRKPTSLAADLVDQAHNHELESKNVYTENERIKALRLAEAKYLRAIQSLDDSLAKSASRKINKIKSEHNGDTVREDEIESPEKLSGNSWLSEDIMDSWYPPVPPTFVLPHPSSEESTMLIRALKGLANLKKTHGETERAEATQLRLVGTLRAARGMYSLETIEACRELGWMYHHSDKPGDALGVLLRSLELAEKSRIRGHSKIEICAALSEDLSIVFRSLKRYADAVNYGEKAVKLLEQGSGGRSDPRCGVLWTTVTADWQALQDQTPIDKQKEIAEEVYFAAKEAVRVAQSTAPSRAKHFSADSWQCVAHLNMLSLLLGRSENLDRARAHLHRAQDACPNLKTEPIWVKAMAEEKERLTSKEVS